MTDPLGKLFGSAARVRLLRLFLMNPEDTFPLEEIVKRSKVERSLARKEIKTLVEAGIVAERVVTVPSASTRANAKPKKVAGWALDHRFPSLSPLRQLLTSVAVGPDDIAARLRGLGKMKFVVASGIFLDLPDSRVDLLVVGNNLKKAQLEGVLRRLEAEVGRELVYGVMDEEEYRYRLGIYDKFVRDILDFPHQVVIDKLGVV